MMLFLPPRKIKCLSLHPLICSLNLLFIYPSHLSLFGFKGSISVHLYQATAEWYTDSQHNVSFRVFLSVISVNFALFIEVWVLQVLTATTMKMTIVWLVAPCSPIETYRRFRYAYYLHYQSDDRGSNRLWNVGSISRRLLGTTFQRTAILIKKCILERIWSYSCVSVKVCLTNS
jgi:hypothetical protein